MRYLAALVLGAGLAAASTAYADVMPVELAVAPTTDSSSMWTYSAALATDSAETSSLPAGSLFSFARTSVVSNLPASRLSGGPGASDVSMFYNDTGTGTVPDTSGTPGGSVSGGTSTSGSSSSVTTPTPVSVQEPAALAVLASALIGLGLIRGRLQIS